MRGKGSERGEGGGEEGGVREERKREWKEQREGRGRG